MKQDTLFLISQTAVNLWPFVLEQILIQDPNDTYWKNVVIKHDIRVTKNLLVRFYTGEGKNRVYWNPCSNNDFDLTQVFAGELDGKVYWNPPSELATDWLAIKEIVSSVVLG